MLKIIVCLTSVSLALCLPLTVFAAPTAPPLPRILVTYQVLEVSGDTGFPDPVPYSDPTSSTMASEFYKALLQTPGAEAAEISVQMPADVLGEARYNRVLTFPVQDHGKPSRISLILPMSLEATPHINPDGTITVQLKTEVTRAAPQLETDHQVPLTNGESWQTTQTFKSGEMRMFGAGDTFTSFRGLVGNSPKVVAENKKLTALQNKVFVPFVTVTILPSAR
jgi:hypothetical protein